MSCRFSRISIWPGVIRKRVIMKGYIVQIEDATRNNQHYRQVLFTAKHSQLVLMSWSRVNKSEKKYTIWINLFALRRVREPSFWMEKTSGRWWIRSRPAGTRHNILNSGNNSPLKLYSLYSPPEHNDGIISRPNAKLTQMRTITLMVEPHRHILFTSRNDHDWWRLSPARFPDISLVRPSP